SPLFGIGRWAIAGTWERLFLFMTASAAQPAPNRNKCRREGFIALTVGFSTGISQSHRLSAGTSSHHGRRTFLDARSQHVHAGSVDFDVACVERRPAVRSNACG